MCACVDALLLPNGVENPPCESLLVNCAVALPDVLPEDTPVSMKAAVIMAQQMIDGACKMTVASALQLGHIDEHDLHPINLLLPLLLHSMYLCQSSDLTLLQQRAAWHTALRAARAITAFVDGTSTTPGKAMRRPKLAAEPAGKSAGEVSTSEAIATPEESTSTVQASGEVGSAPSALPEAPTPANEVSALVSKKGKGANDGTSKPKKQGGDGKKTKRSPAKS